MSTLEQGYYEYCMANNKPYFGRFMAAGQGLPIRHAYMQALIKHECNNRYGSPFNILEIGSWAGGSAITWADAIKRFNGGKGFVVCVDLWKPFFEPSDYSEFDDKSIYHDMADALSDDKIYNLFSHNIKASKYDDIIIPCRGKSVDILPLFCEGKFDLVFIDGDHTYKNVAKDLSVSARLVPEGGILCGDDLELQVLQIDKIHAKINSNMDFILDPQTNKQYHPGVALAVGEFFGEVSVWEGFWAMRKCGRGGWKKVNPDSCYLNNLHIPDHLDMLPGLVAEGYKGYNIVSYASRFYALAQSLGPVDLPRIEERILHEYKKSRKCVVGGSLEEVRQRVDQL